MCIGSTPILRKFANTARSYFGPGLTRSMLSGIRWSWAWVTAVIILSMDIQRALTTDAGTDIPWLISQAKLTSIVGADCLTTVTTDYLVTRCSLLGGLNLSLGFHFKGSKLLECELFRHLPVSLAESYAEFQQHLTLTFGAPTQTIPGGADAGYGCGYDHHEWRFGRTRIRHYVLDRFGCEEHVRIAY